MRWDRSNGMEISNLGARKGIHEIQSIDGGPVLRVNTRKCDGDILAIRAGENIVKQSEPVRSLDLDQCINRMRFVIYANVDRKFDSWCKAVAALVFRSFD